MKKSIALALILCLLMVLVTACGNGGGSSVADVSTPAAASTDQGADEPAGDSADKKSIGFVVMGLDGEFFQGLAKTYEARFTEAGWEPTVISGEHNVEVQIEAIENLTAMGVDVIWVFPTDGAAINDAVKQAMNSGIKVIEMVNTGSDYDAAQLSDERIMGEYLNKLACSWVDEAFPDAEDGSIECVVVTNYISQTATEQAEIALQIADYSSKLKFVGEVEVADLSTEAGVSAGEDIFTMYPDVKVITCTQNQHGIGVANYLTSMKSPVSDFGGIGIFASNATSEEAFELIRSSANGESPLRATLVTSGIGPTVDEALELATGLMDGSIASGEIRYATYELITADTVDEFLANGKAASFTTADLDALIPVTKLS